MALHPGKLFHMLKSRKEPGATGSRSRRDLPMVFGNASGEAECCPVGGIWMGFSSDRWAVRFWGVSLAAAAAVRARGTAEPWWWLDP